jgi:hypothetical protein
MSTPAAIGRESLKTSHITTIGMAQLPPVHARTLLENSKGRQWAGSHQQLAGSGGCSGHAAGLQSASHRAWSTHKPQLKVVHPTHGLVEMSCFEACCRPARGDNAALRRQREGSRQ